MSIWENKDIKQIEKLVLHGEFKKANDKLSALEKQEKLTKNTLIEIKIVKANMMRSASWTEGLEIIDPVIEELKTKDKPLLLNEAFLVKALCFRIVQRLDDALEILEEAEKKLKKKLTTKDPDYKLGMSRLLLQRGECYNFSGELDLALKVLKKSLTMVKSLENKNLQLEILSQLGTNAFFRANYEEAIKHFKKALVIAEENKNNYQIANAHDLLAQGYQRIGKFEDAAIHIGASIKINMKMGRSIIATKYVLALNHYSKGEIKKTHDLFREILPVWEPVPNPRVKSLVLWMKSSLEWYSGSIEKTIEYLSEAVEILKSINDKYLSTLLAIYLASALNDKGEYDKALELSIENFKIFKEYNNTWFNTYYYDLLGKIYQAKGNYNLALENAQMSYELRKKINSIRGMIQSLFYIVTISIDKNDIVLYNKYLEELKTLVEKHPNPFHIHIYQIAQALVLKASTRPRDWMKALELLVSVVDEEYEDKKFSIIALNNLCELLMIEFSISGDEYVLKELDEHIERLDNIAKYQNNFALKLETTNIQIMTLWLKAQYSVTDIDMQNARELLNETRNLADEHGLIRLAEKMSQQQERLLGQVTIWDDFIRKYYEFIKE